MPLVMCERDLCRRVRELRFNSTFRETIEWFDSTKIWQRPNDNSCPLTITLAETRKSVAWLSGRSENINEIKPPSRWWFLRSCTIRSHLDARFNARVVEPKDFNYYSLVGPLSIPDIMTKLNKTSLARHAINYWPAEESERKKNVRERERREARSRAG